MLAGGGGGLRGARRGRHRVAADSSAAHSELPSGANERVFQLSRKSKRFYAGNFGSRGPSGICGVGRMRKRGRIPDGLPARSPYVGSEVRRPLKLSEGPGSWWGGWDQPSLGTREGSLWDPKAKITIGQVAGKYLLPVASRLARI